MKTIASVSLLRLLALWLAWPAMTFAQEETRGASGVIGARDMVEIRVHREDDLTTRAQLSANGTVTMPLIGAVRLLGLTTDQAATSITAKLKDGWLVDPQVSVTIEERVRRSVTVLGQVREPGVFRLTTDRKLTLVEALGMAGGMTRIANARKVTLRRGGGGETRTINVRDIMNGRANDIDLRDGDVINVPEGLF